MSTMSNAGMIALPGSELRDSQMTDGSAVGEKEEAMAEEVFETAAGTTLTYY